MLQEWTDDNPNGDVEATILWKKAQICLCLCAQLENFRYETSLKELKTFEKDDSAFWVPPLHFAYYSWLRCATDVPHKRNHSTIKNYSIYGRISNIDPLKIGFCSEPKKMNTKNGGAFHSVHCNRYLQTQCWRHSCIYRIRNLLNSCKIIEHDWAIKAAHCCLICATSTKHGQILFWTTPLVFPCCSKGNWSMLHR